MKLKIYLALAILLTITMSAYGANDNAFYDLRAAHIECRANLSYEYHKALAPFAMHGTIPPLAQVRADMRRLNSSSFGNRTEFNEFVSGAANPHITAALAALRAARVAILQDIRADVNLTNVQKMNRIQRINVSWTSANSNYTRCDFRTYRPLIRFNQRELNVTIDRWSAVIQNMSRSGYDVSEMREVMRNATKLRAWESRAFEARNVSEQRVYRKAISGSQFHIYARFNIARIRSMLDEYDAIARSKGFGADVDSIRSLLNQASNLAKPGRVYQDGDIEKVWSNIREAAARIRELVRKMNAAGG